MSKKRNGEKSFSNDELLIDEKQIFGVVVVTLRFELNSFFIWNGFNDSVCDDRSTAVCECDDVIFLIFFHLLGDGDAASFDCGLH